MFLFFSTKIFSMNLSARDNNKPALSKRILCMRRGDESALSLSSKNNTDSSYKLFFRRGVKNPQNCAATLLCRPDQLFRSLAVAVHEKEAHRIYKRAPKSYSLLKQCRCFTFNKTCKVDFFWGVINALN